MNSTAPLLAFLVFSTGLQAMADCTAGSAFLAPVRLASSADQVVLVRDLDSDGAFAPRATFDTTLANVASASLRMRAGAVELLVNERSGRLGILRIADGAASVSTLDGPFDSNLAAASPTSTATALPTSSTPPRASGAREPNYVTLANADGTFRERKQLAATRKTTLPSQVRVADVDHDGNPDLIVSDFRTTTLYWYRGDGRGNFGDGSPIDAAAPLNSFDVADVNHDDYPDVVTANDDHTLSVIVNRGPCNGGRRRAAKH